MATPNTGGSGQLTQDDTKTSFNPRQPGRFPGDYKITKCVIISPTRGAESPIDLQDGDGRAVALSRISPSIFPHLVF